MLKSTVHTATKNTFFQKANYFEPQKYNAHFDSENEIVKRENEEIQRILKENIKRDMTITDIGCGSGLGRSLIDNPYIGVDNVSNSIEFCKQNYDGVFRCIDADDYVDQVESLNPLFLFSSDYLRLDTMQKYIDKTDEVFIAVHLDKPYLSSTSVYSDQPETYYEFHPRAEIEEVKAIMLRNGAHMFRLLDQDYYLVSIIHK